MFQNIPNKIAPDESAATGNENAHRCMYQSVTSAAMRKRIRLDTFAPPKEANYQVHDGVGRLARLLITTRLAA